MVKNNVKKSGVPKKLTPVQARIKEQEKRILIVGEKVEMERHTRFKKAEAEMVNRGTHGTA